MADLSAFLEEAPAEAVPAYVPSREEVERRTRIRLAVYAYAYEYEASPLISDGEYDELSKSVDLSVSTGNEALDKYFRESFEPDTGMWIRSHPELDRVKALHYQYKHGFANTVRIGNEVYRRD
jgi:hypothetical protein